MKRIRCLSLPPRSQQNPGQHTSQPHADQRQRRRQWYGGWILRRIARDLHSKGRETGDYAQLCSQKLDRVRTCVPASAVRRYYRCIIDRRRTEL